MIPWFRGWRIAHLHASAVKPKAKGAASAPGTRRLLLAAGTAQGSKQDLSKSE